jgi:ABC-type Fe3+ transport system substrate-binding protein
VARSARAPAIAQRFIAYLLGATGQAILKKHNFLPVG